MAAVTTKFVLNTDALSETVSAAVRAGMLAAAEHYQKTMQQVVRENDNGPPSRPGEPPHGQSDMAHARGMEPLADSIKIEDNEEGVFVFSALAHARYLELGTSRMAPRPLWSITLANETETMQKILVDTARKHMEANK